MNIEWSIRVMRILKERQQRILIRKRSNFESVLVKEVKDADLSVPMLSLKDLLRDKTSNYTN